MLDNLNDFTNALSTRLADYLLAFAAVGALTMAVIQTLKELTPVRGWFHRRALNRWLSSHMAPLTDDVAFSHPLRQFSAAHRAKAANEPPLLHAELDSCRAQLILLSTGDSAALYALEIERLAGQLNAAATIVTDFPRNYPRLLRCLASNAAREDVEHLIDDVPPLEPDAHADAQVREAWKAYLESKVRVANQIQRNIDGFQIATAYRWAWGLQLCSFALSLALAFVGVAYGDDRTGFDRIAFSSALPVALAAGFLAPIARDLLAFITKR